MNIKIVKIALNNVIKQKRRSMFNALTFAANAFAIIFLLGQVTGMYEATFDRVAEIETGHFKIYNAEYEKDKDRMPLEHNIRDAEAVIDEISKLPFFVSAAPRIAKTAEISDMKRKTGVLVVGIDMRAELETMKIFDRMDESQYLSAGAGGELLMGARLARLMEAEPGIPFLIYGRTMLKANNLSDLTLKGIYSIGFEKMEKSVVYVPIGFARGFFDMEGAATEIIVRLEERKRTDVVKPLLDELLAEKYPGLTAKAWYEEAAALVAGVQMDYIFYGVFLAILLFLAVFIIMNTLTITVFERTAEIGTLRAIGLEKNQIRWMFMFEGVFLAFGGAIIGGLLAIPAAYYMNVYGISIPEEMYDQMPFPIESMKSINTVFDWLLTTAICVVTGAIGSIIPANRAAGIKVVDALKKGVR